MDTSWIDLPVGHPQHVNGCMQFIEYAKVATLEGKILCPCKNCKVEKWFRVDEVESHILFKGFFPSYRNWFFHGSGDMIQRMIGNDGGSTTEGSGQKGLAGRDDMGGLLKSAFGVNVNPNDLNSKIWENDDCINKEPVSEFNDSTIEEEKAKYKKLLEASEEQLYEGCTSFSKLSFLLHLFHLKCMNHWSAESFDMLLTLLIDAFPQILDFPTTYYQSKKVIKDLGLGYEKIDACPNNCMLYWGEFLKRDRCHICGTSRWKTTKCKTSNINDQDNSSRNKKSPAKVMRYFALIPRLKRIYMSSKTSKDMRWHHAEKLKEDNKKILRHPSDALAWKDFDQRYEDFASDPRSVRLGLASDGFNPYRLMNTTYSMWPVVLIPYNLPPWLCMKQSSFILSTLIPGKTSPGIDIDVYLQPLVHELKLLWNGVISFDFYDHESFQLRAALLWTINDFPAYAMLSGLSTKGYNACPICIDSTPADKFGKKICYCKFRKWLPSDHPYRFESEKFNGLEEHEEAPTRPSGADILKLQEQIGYVYGKTSKRKRGGDTNQDAENETVARNPVGTKRSILYDLEYWEGNLLRHNLDVMHIEKNVCDNILGTLLSMDKSRDKMEDREALKELGIKSHLWIQSLPNGNTFMPSASYSMSVEEKDRFLRVLLKLKVPDGYGSNLSRCVNMKQRKLINLKSHDSHVLMQDILPVALRASNATKVIGLLAKLSSFFKKLCSTTIDPDCLDDLQGEVILTLCQLEIEFLPSFFTIMVHLLIHLVEEVKLGGPVHYRWMYPIERYLAHLKSHVTNKAQPEGSIAEGFLLEETVRFCSRYFEGVKTTFNIPKRIEDDIPNQNCYLFNTGGHAIGKEVNMRLDDKSLKQAHRYVLLHSDEIQEDVKVFLHQKREMRNLKDPITESDESKWIVNEFGAWMQLQEHLVDATCEDGRLRKALARGLNDYGKQMKGFMINGYKFLAMDRDCHLTTQNSGIMVEADGADYYGKVKDIYELDYFGDYKVVLFRCDWVDLQRGIKTFPNGSICVNFSKLMHTGRLLQDDPFIFSSQGKQVFYVEDELHKGWLHVVKTKPRDLFDLGDSLPLVEDDDY